MKNVSETGFLTPRVPASSITRHDEKSRNVCQSSSHLSDCWNKCASERLCPWSVASFAAGCTGPNKAVTGG